MKSITVKDTRINLSEIIELVAGGNHSFVITKFGKPKAQIIPLSQKPMSVTKPHIMSQFIGMHKNRLDWKNKSNKQISQELRKSTWVGK